MSTHLVTARQNVAHVTSDDEAHLNAQIMGDGQYLLTENWTPSLLSASTVSLPVGDWMWNGHYMRITAQEQMSIGNGVQSGSTRDDLICFHYSRDTRTGVENANIVIIRGQINRGVGVPPITTSLLNSPTESYMVFAVIHWSGITPSVKSVAEGLPSIRNLNSRLDAAAQTTSIRLPYMDRNVTFYKIGKTVTVSQQVLTTSTGTNAHFTASAERVPDGYRPVNQGVLLMSDNTGTSASMMVNSLGQIEVNGTINGSRYLQVFGSWITA